MCTEACDDFLRLTRILEAVRNAASESPLAGTVLAARPHCLAVQRALDAVLVGFHDPFTES
jgi:hypothetical protein